MRQIPRRMEIIHPTIGWRRNEHRTHKHAHDSWILWSVSRVRPKTMHSLSCITSLLPYITLCYTDSRFFPAPGTIAHGSIRLPPRSLASSRGCSLALSKIPVVYIFNQPNSLTWQVSWISFACLNLIKGGSEVCLILNSLVISIRSVKGFEF